MCLTLDGVSRIRDADAIFRIDRKDDQKIAKNLKLFYRKYFELTSNHSGSVRGTLWQTRHNFVGEIRIFSVKIRINPYPSFMHRCIAKTFTRFIPYHTSLPKNRDIAAKNQNRSFRSHGATVGLGLRLWLTTGQSSSTGDEISRFSEIYGES